MVFYIKHHGVFNEPSQALECELLCIPERARLMLSVSLMEFGVFQGMLEFGSSFEID